MKTKMLLLILAVAGINVANAAILQVPAQYQTIQAAIMASQYGDTVLVSPGTYFENINFRGKGVVVASLFLTTGDTTYIESTVINGSQPVHPDTASCVIISGPNLTASNDSSAALIGFRITGGTGTRWNDEHNPGAIYREGGGILIQYSSPRIFFNHICYNQAVNLANSISAGGGAIRCGDGNPKIRNNVIDHNQGRYGAGLVFNYSGVDIRNNVIAMNWGGEDFGGGGIWAYGTDGLARLRKVVNNTIVYNSSQLGGGGIRVWSSSMLLTNNILYSNSAPVSPQLMVSGSVEVTYCDVQGGYAGNGNLDADPLFDAMNYYLQTLSGCIDNGDPSAVFNDPPDPGNPSGAQFPSKGTLRNDIGAYGGPGSALMANIPSVMTGIGNHTRTGDLAISPNPATDKVVILLQEGMNSVKILTMTGVVLRNFQFNGKEQAVIDLSSLPTGAYLVSVSAVSGTTTNRIVLRR